ncbi:MAG: hypothetical protein IJC89_01595 [Clostridia bacterium]|nr:hypothetical protein [Clostridia bacterium]
MKKSIILWQTIGFIVISVLGVLLHFLYDWTGLKFIGLFSAVNESTWEHMKLMYFPMFLSGLMEYAFFFREYENFWCIKLKGIVIGLILIPVLFYTLGGIFGNSSLDWVNIAIFFLSAIWALVCETREFKKENTNCKLNKTAFVAICIIGALFMLFTFFTPEIPIFQNPIDGSFGINNQI